MFREDKATAMVTFFLSRIKGNCMNDVKLMKLLYLSERESVKRYGVPISQDSFASMKKGPVLSKTYDFMKGKVSGDLWNRHIAPMNGYSISMVQPMDIERVLRGCDIETLEYIWHEHGHKSKEELVNHCHKFDEYDKRAENPSPGEPRSYTLTLKEMMIAIGDTEEVATKKVDELAFYGSM